MLAWKLHLKLKPPLKLPPKVLRQTVAASCTSCWLKTHVQTFANTACALGSLIPPVITIEIVCSIPSDLTRDADHVAVPCNACNAVRLLSTQRLRKDEG